jgi:tyrosine-protein phosphatase YwqE
MGIFRGLFGGKKKDEAAGPVRGPVLVDIHTQLRPGIDDGVDNWEESLAIIHQLMELGYKKAITTPHIMADFYHNTPEIINPLLAELNGLLKEKNIDFKVEAAAEYYIDENLDGIIKSGNLLSFGDRYVLIETSYLVESQLLTQTIFNLKVAGYNPVIAHPERYQYMFTDFEKYKALYQQGVNFQINLASLGGYYGKESKKMAEKLIKEGMVQFVGTDVHHMKHIRPLQHAMESPGYAALTALPLKNNSLL